MREKQEFLEARKSSLQHTIETAREELTRVEVAIARNVLTMMQTASAPLAGGRSSAYQ